MRAESDRARIEAFVRTDVVHLLADLDPDRAWGLFVSIEPELVRYPSIDPTVFRAKVKRALAR